MSTLEDYDPQAEPAKTRVEIIDLKRQWRNDPGCWDIEHTPGFEAHQAELLAYRLDFEAKRRQTERDRFEAYCSTNGLTDNKVLALYLYGIIGRLESEIERLVERIDKLENKS